MRTIPRLMNPRLPVDDRWLRFCSSPFARDLRRSARGCYFTAQLLAVAIAFWMTLGALSAVGMVSVGGPA